MVKDVVIEIFVFVAKVCNGLGGFDSRIPIRGQCTTPCTNEDGVFHEVSTATVVAEWAGHTPEALFHVEFAVSVIIDWMALNVFARNVLFNIFISPIKDGHKVLTALSC